MWENIFSFSKFSREFAWLGKMQKSGKFSSDTLFFPLPYAYEYLHSALENSVWRSFAERTALVGWDHDEYLLRHTACFRDLGAFVVRH
jgi:hypothetical protein